jgi:hypothetical protein
MDAPWLLMDWLWEFVSRSNRKLKTQNHGHAEKEVLIVLAGSDVNGRFHMATANHLGTWFLSFFHHLLHVSTVFTYNLLQKFFRIN